MTDNKCPLCEAELLKDEHLDCSYCEECGWTEGDPEPLDFADPT